MWSYLSNSASSEPKLLTFECVDSKDVNSLAKGYCELIMEKFFSGFSSEYDTIFISKYSPNSNPQNKPKLFEMRFDNYIESSKYIVEKQN